MACPQILTTPARRMQVASVAIQTNHLYLKLFKDVPKADIDMLMPGCIPIFPWCARS